MKIVIVEKQFIYKGYECVINLSFGGWRCGYVALTPLDLLFNKPLCEIIDLVDIKCHGGLTFAGIHPIEGHDINKYWIGFDCIHTGDGYDFDSVLEKCCETDSDIEHVIFEIAQNFNKPYEHIWSMSDVQFELESIVDQIIEYNIKES